LNGNIPILKIGTTLITTVHVELDDAVADAFQVDVLTTIEKTGAKGLVIDISGLQIVDSYVARVLTETTRMARLMGTHTVLVGMRPEVSATLVTMGYAVEGIQTALDLERGLALLGKRLQ
jgi:rsbT antagonist protein RsbS